MCVCLYLQWHPPPACTHFGMQVYLGVSALVTRGTLDVVGAILDSHQQLDAVSGDANKQRKARERAAQQAAVAAAAAKTEQSKQINR